LATWQSAALINDNVKPRRRLLWIAPSPLLQSSFSVVSHELLTRLSGYDTLYLGQNYMGEPRQMANYTLASYSTGEHILHFMNVFKPDVTVLFQSPPYLQRFNPMAKMIADKSRLLVYMPVESSPLGADVAQVCNEADLVLVPSKWSQQQLQAYGADSEVLMHGVDTSVFKPAPKPAEFTVGAIASHVWRKQLTRFLDAHKLAENNGFKTRCLMVTSTYDMAAWQPEIKTYASQIKSTALFNETAYMNLPINQKEIATLYDQMHCHILTSTEAFGLPNLEAMASATVPIIVNHGGSPELVGDCGLYARISDYFDTVIGKIALVDIADLADKITWAYTHPEELKSLAQKSTERAKLFNWQDATSKLAEYLEA
jgi:glycosyltransferase involved in cell wall biosynthesis